MLSNSNPRIVISGLSGDSGKTVVSCGLTTCFKDRGLGVSCFKKGPDYIDSAWLTFASGKPARNLDTYLMGFQTVKYSFMKNSVGNEISLVEGNRGLFDGYDSKGTHSTAELAKLLRSPVIIVQNLSKVTRTAAASILGCKHIDPELNIGGVILNQVAGERHGKVAKDAIEDLTGIPVLGLIPKLQDRFILPSRYLGLITPEEYEQKSVILTNLKNIMEDCVDISKVLEIAGTSLPLESAEADITREEPIANHQKLKIGYFRDKSFSFYYPENLEMLESSGAELIPFSPADDVDIEDLDLIYIGGGFPESNLTRLSVNHKMINSIRRLVEKGLPIYAECGGLMYLAEEILWDGREVPLSGVLPIKVEMHKKPKGHGYCEAIVDGKNPFFETGTSLKGHEFHYSSIYQYEPEITSTFSVTRGKGCFDKRDGLNYKNVLASYIHIHALSTPEWVTGMINSAKNYRKLNKSKIVIGE